MIVAIPHLGRLRRAGAAFETRTEALPGMQAQTAEHGAIKAVMTADDVVARRKQGSITGLFPVLWIDAEPVHEALAICEWVAETYAEAHLWPEDSVRRAQARAVSSEMAAGFGGMRAAMGCHVFARVPEFKADAALSAEIERVFDIWQDCLDRLGGPFLFGDFSIADCMYFPMMTRFETYGISLPAVAEAYELRLDTVSCVQDWRATARQAPRIPVYDDQLRKLGGDPDAVL